MRKFKFILGLFLLIGTISCDKENETVPLKFKNGSYMGSLNYDNQTLWESFIIRNDSFEEIASGGVWFQKFPVYCLTKGTYEIVNDSIYFNNIKVAQPPNGEISDYQTEYLLMGSYFIEEFTDSSIVFSRMEKSGNQVYDLKLYYE